jgi:excisionase family DNA binding protein
MTEKVAYTVDEAAASAGVSAMTIRRALSTGALEAHYPTARPLILRDDLIAWIATAPTERQSA